MLSKNLPDQVAHDQAMNNIRIGLERKRTLEPKDEAQPSIHIKQACSSSPNDPNAVKQRAGNLQKLNSNQLRTYYQQRSQNTLTMNELDP